MKKGLTRGWGKFKANVSEGVSELQRETVRYARNPCVCESPYIITCAQCMLYAFIASVFSP
eukprot:COSAG05_NODE_21409_length_272_cov_0.595376_1_plen_60_part_01